MPCVLLLLLSCGDALLYCYVHAYVRSAAPCTLPASTLICRDWSRKTVTSPGFLLLGEYTIWLYMYATGVSKGRPIFLDVS